MMLRLTFLASLLVISNSHAAELKDPFLRDDDISGTTLTVSVTMDAVGNYVYKYDLEAPSTNTGRIIGFDVDATCDEEVDQKGFNPYDYPSDGTSYLSEDIPHVPVALEAPYGEAASVALSVNSIASWILSLNPGESASGLTIVSPYPPGDRTYWLVPSADYKSDEYDYETALKSENRDSIPWIEDWTVTGLTQGPACPGHEYPDNGTGTPKFEGTLVKSDTEETNALLTYSQPLVDQMTLEPGATEITFTIHYNENIDPKTFRVTPASSGWAKLFHPAPGENETITLPVGEGKHRIQLNVKGVKDHASSSKGRGEQKGGVREDKDVFIIRVPESSSGGEPHRGMK